MPELRRIRDELLVPFGDSLAASARLPNGWSAHTDAVAASCDIELITSLTTKAATFLSIEKMDPWLAPRLHNALRISRRIASDDGMWAWLAFQCQEFVEARFGRNNRQLHPWRYRGAWSRNALSRLWWGAEMTRNGPDYSAVELCFARTRTAQFGLELMYSWDRAAAIAFVRVAEGADGGERLPDQVTNELSTRLKVLLTLRSLDGFGSEDEDFDEFDERWASHSPSLHDLLRPSIAELTGPSIGTCSSARIDALSYWFREIVATTVDAERERVPAV